MIFSKPKIELIQGDITKVECDAIVNAANESLLGGGGVDGAIHHVAGPKLLEECRSLNGCDTGKAKITGAYELPARHVIHTVGPVWHGGTKGEQDLLASCYRECLSIAEKHHLKCIAFPNISTGVYRFPKELAADIAIDEVKGFLKGAHSVHEVIFVVFDDENLQIYKQRL